MATNWISPTWRMPTDTESPAGTGNNQSKLDNYSLYFSGVSEWIVLGNDTLLDSKTAFSFSVWVYPTLTQQLYAGIMGYHTANDEAVKLHFGGTPANNQVTIGVFEPGNTAITTSSVDSVPLNTWTHIAVVGNASLSNVNLYINGTLDNDSVSGNMTSISQGSDFYIGTGSGATTSREFQGKISQPAIFDYALTDGTSGTIDQVSDLYNSGTPSNPMALSPTPIAYYPLGGSATGSASTLTIPNESVPSATAFDFGASDYIDLGNDESLQITGAITLSMWVKMNAAGNQGFMSKSLTPYFGAANQKYFNIGVLNPDIYWQIGNGTIASSASYGFASYMDGNWHHVVGTFDGTLDPDNVRLYIDGVYVDSGSAAFDTIKGDSVYPLCISDRTKVYDSGMEMANAQIWDSNLTDGGVAVSAVAGGEIATLYNNGTPYTGTQPQAANLQGWWKMNVDTSTWNGSDWIIGEAQANYTTAFDFDGAWAVGASISLGTPPELQISSALTVSIWFKTTNNGMALITQDSASSSTVDRNWYMYITGNKLKAACWNASQSGTTWAKSVLDVNDGSWHHAVMIYTPSTSVELWVDGDLVDTGTSNVEATINNGNIKTAIGEWGVYHGEKFIGEISNVNIWDSSLSGTDVTTLYNNGTPLLTGAQPQAANLQGWWKLDNTATWTGSAFSVPDASENNNTGTSSGMTESNLVNASVSTLNGVSSGMTTANLVTSDLTRSIPYSSYSMEFDGTSDYINCGNNSSLQPASAYSYSAWFKASDIIGTEAIISNTTRGFLTWLEAAKLKVWHYNNGSGWVNFLSSATIVADTWYHIVVTWDLATTTLKLYVNGVLDNNITTATAIQYWSDDFNIGAYAGANPFNGKISNASIWDTALSEDQIITIYNGGVPNDISSLSPVSWWSLAGDSYYNGSDWICPDLGSGGNNGTSANMAGTELVGDGPGSTANGIATSMDIPTNLKGEAPNSTSNAISINMTAVDRVTSVPG